MTNLARPDPMDAVVLEQVSKVAASVRSLTATISMSAPFLAAARRNNLPIRPKPLIAILVVISSHSLRQS